MAKHVIAAEVEAAAARFADPRLGLRATEADLRRWAEGGAALDPPLGPEDAIRRMIPTTHLGLAHEVARAYRGASGGDLDDLVSAGMLGLTVAARKFDPARCLHFSTYASHWVRQSILRHFRDEAALVRLPAWLRPHVLRAEADPRSLDALTRSQRRHVLAAMRTGARRVVRDGDGDGGRGDGDGRRLAELVADPGCPPPGSTLVADPSAVRALLGAIPRERDRAIVAAWHGLDGAGRRTKRALAARHGVPVERIAQVVEAGVRAMREAAARGGLAFDDCLVEPGEAGRRSIRLPSTPGRRAGATAPDAYRGVRRAPNGRWEGRISLGEGSSHVGRFDTQEECRAAVDAAALARFGVADYTRSSRRAASRPAGPGGAG